MSGMFVKLFKTTLKVLLLVLLLVTIFLLCLPTIVDTNWFKNKVSSELTDGLKRRVHLKGSVDLKLGRITSLSVSDVVIENPQGMTDRQMLSIGQLSIAVPVVANMLGDLRVEEVLLRNVQALVAEDDQGKSNWKFSNDSAKTPPEESSELSLPIVEVIKLENVGLSLKVGKTLRELYFNNLLARSIDLEDLSSISSSLAIDGIPIILKGGMSSLEDYLLGANLELEINLQQMESHIAAKGILQADGKLKLDLKLSGPNLSDLSEILKAELPALKDYAFSSNLSYSPGKRKSLSFASSSLKIGGSDISGDFTIELSPLVIKASLTSEVFDLGVLSNEVAEDEVAENEISETPEEPKGEAGIPFELLRLLEADIDLELGKLKVTPNLELSDTVLSLKIEDGELRVPTFSAQALGGSLGGVLSAAAGKLQLELNAQDLELEAATGLAGGSPLISGAVDVHLDTQSAGSTLSEILKNLKGKLEIASDAAELNSSTLEAISSGLFGILSPIFGDAKQAEIECAIFRFDIKNGVAKSKEQALKLGEVFIFAEGELDLTKNELDFSFNVNSNNPTLASLIPPFKAFGQLGDPSFAPSLSGTIASVVDTTQGVVGSATGLVEGAARAVVGAGKEKLSGVALCEEAYAEEQALLTSRVGSIIDGDDTPSGMHQSWDIDGDGINDCESDGTCDDMVDYFKPRALEPMPLESNDQLQ